MSVFKKILSAIAINTPQSPFHKTRPVPTRPTRTSYPGIKYPDNCYYCQNEISNENVYSIMKIVVNSNSSPKTNHYHEKCFKLISGFEL